jgi:anaerobic magnesium-protoporphyrin IX monomethyl ester cyclase
MKVLFVNVVKDLAVQRAHYPLGFGYMVSYCRKFGLELDCVYAENLTDIQRVNPDVVAFSCITENFNLCKQYAALVKRFNPKIKVLIGGVHVSAVPDSLTCDFDVGVLGEGEQTFYELALNNFEPSRKIAGLYFNGVKTVDRSLIEPLDIIPYADRLIYKLGQRDSYVFTSRGCSYRCKFCSSSRFWKKTRLHSAEYVAGELRQLRDSGVRHVTIFDDTFLLSLSRVKVICELVKDYGLSFNVAARANQITDEALTVFKQMGVVKVGMGLESNSAKVLEWLEKGNTPIDNQCAVDLLHKHKIPFVASFICGTPVESKADLAETYRFIKHNHVEFDMYRLMPFPNTPIYDGRRDWDSCRIRMVKPGVVDRLKRKLHVTNMFVA